MLLRISIHWTHHEPLLKYYYSTNQFVVISWNWRMISVEFRLWNSVPIVYIIFFNFYFSWNKEKFIKSYNSVVSSGKAVGTVVKLFSRQSTIPSAHRHGCGHSVVAPHSIGAFSVRPWILENKKMFYCRSPHHNFLSHLVEHNPTSLIYCNFLLFHTVVIPHNRSRK